MRQQAIDLLEGKRRPVWKHGHIWEQLQDDLRPLTRPIVKEECIQGEMPEVGCFQEWWKSFFTDTYPDYEVELYRTEMRIWDRKALVPGTIDCVVILHPRATIPPEWKGKTLVLILDWKRSRKLEMECLYGRKRYLLPPFEMLEVCNGSEFTFQLNAYKYILEKYYPIHGKPVLVVDMYACVFNRELSGGSRIQKLRDVSQAMHKFWRQRILDVTLI
jgi:hypothetical protein